jgi:hypothetical protein
MDTQLMSQVEASNAGQPPAPCPVPDDGVVLALPVPVTVVAAAAKILFKYIFTIICF